MSNSPPASPLTVMKAQLVLEKSKKANSKSRKSKKDTGLSSTPSTSKATTTTTTCAKDGPDQDPADSDKENGSESINWAKNPTYTTSLLNIIEDSNRYRQGLGFKVVEQTGSGGAKVAQLCRDIAEKLFPRSSIPLAKLGKSIESRIRSVKKKYHEFRAQLGQTGHGLVIEDRTAEIISGTPIYNVWDKIRLKFPWYAQLHRLLTGSPVYEKAGIANSTSLLDTRVLGARAVIHSSSTEIQLLSPTPAETQTLPPTLSETQLLPSATQPLSPTTPGTQGLSQTPRRRHESLDWDEEAMDASFAEGSDDIPPVSAPANSTTPVRPPASSTPPISSQAVVQAVDVPPSTASPPEQSTPAGGKKRKDPYVHVQELTATYSQSRLESDRVRAESKRLRLESQIKIQEMRNAEQERQRQHEASLIDKKIFLAQLEARNITSNLSFPSTSSTPVLDI